MERAAGGLDAVLETAGFRLKCRAIGGGDECFDGPGFRPKVPVAVRFGPTFSYFH